MKTIMLLGGYGRIGAHLARWLLQQTDASVVVAGRHPEKADDLAARLNREVPGQRVAAVAADAASADSLRQAFRNVNLVLDCTSTARHTGQIARAALAAGVDCLEYHFSSKVLPALRPLAADLEKSGRSFIAQGGFHPGLLAPLVRFAAPRFSRYHQAAVGLIMNFTSVSWSESATEFAEEVGACRSTLWRAGKWRQVGWRSRRAFDFGPGFGVRTCMPLEFEELRALPERYGLDELGAYVAGFNAFVDGLVIPMSLLLGKVRRGLGAGWLGRCWVWGMNTFARPPYGVVMSLEAEGEQEDGTPLSVRVVLRHQDVFEFTAIPVVACVRQYLDGTIARPGVWLMGEVVEPDRLFADMEQMGVGIEVEVGGPVLVQA
jgi:saccharopine dehydrogenase (NAD+, L-lysine-forming)